MVVKMKNRSGRERWLTINQQVYATSSMGFAPLARAAAGCRQRSVVLVRLARPSLAAIRPQTVLILIGLVVALSLPNPVSAQLADAGVWPPGHVILARLLPALGVGVLYHGLRSKWQRRLWRRLQGAR